MTDPFPAHSSLAIIAFGFFVGWAIKGFYENNRTDRF